MATETLAGLEKRLGFVWRNPALLEEALTHSSYTCEDPGTKNNQRLEFLGDAVLEVLVSEALFHRLPDAPEGDLTKLRAAVVCEPSLARVAADLGLGHQMRMGRGEELSGGRTRPSVLADAFEAVLGALYLDQGLDAARTFVRRHLGRVIEDVIAGRGEPDYKTELQERLQKISPDPIKYVILQEEGPDHAKTFTAGVVYRGALIGQGVGRSKKEAEQQAAKAALARRAWEQQQKEAGHGSLRPSQG